MTFYKKYDFIITLITKDRFNWKNNSQIIKTLPYVHKELWFHYKPDDVAKIILGHKKILSDEVKVNQALLGIPTQE